MKIINKMYPLLLIICLSFFAVQSLLMPGFFTMHDDQQIARLFELNDAVQNGQIPPRWVSHLGFGYGYPLFNFYPPVVYYLGELIHLTGFSFIDATKIVMMLGFVLSGLFMYLWVSNHYGRKAGVVAAVLYMYAPYHAVDLYVRGAFAEFFSFVWIPAIFWATDKLFEKKSLTWSMILGIFLSLLVLTHNLIALSFTAFFVLYAASLFFKQNGDRLKVIFMFLIAGLTGIGLSAYFWLPSLLEKQYTLVDTILTRELASYKLHFVCVKQLLNSAWGYGGSIPDCNDGFSFEVGKVQIVLALFAGIYLAWQVISKRKVNKNNFISVICFILFLFSLFMASKYSKFIWDSIQALAYLQFPWRFLLFSAVFSSFLGGFVTFIIWKRFPNRIGYALICSIVVVAIALVASYFVPNKQLLVTDSLYTTNQDIEWRISKTSFEYVPKGVATVFSDIQTTQLAIEKTDIPSQPLSVVKGDVKIQILENIPHKKLFVVEAKTPSVLRINTYSFPGWEVFIDSKKSTYADNNKLKLITITVEKGTHKILVKFTDTWPRILGNYVSVFTGIAVVIIGIIAIKKRRI